MRGQERIEEVYVFVCLDVDGTEGVPAVQLPALPGVVVPMMGADMARAENFRAHAEQLAKDGRPVTLLRFTGREVVERFEAFDG